MEKDICNMLETEPWKVEEKIVLRQCYWGDDRDNKHAYCFAEKQITGPYYLLRSLCRHCAIDDCDNRTKNGWLFLDNLPDCDHDMCCCSDFSGRDVLVLTDKRRNRTAVCGNYHMQEDVCLFFFDQKTNFRTLDRTVLDEAQKEILEKLDPGFGEIRETRTNTFETDCYRTEFIRFSVLEELPENFHEARKRTREIYKEQMNRLPTRFTIRDYCPERKSRFLKTYNTTLARNCVRYTDNKAKMDRIQSRLGLTCGECRDKSKTWRELDAENGRVAKTVYELLPGFRNEDLLMVLRKHYPKYFNAADLTDSNPDYVIAKGFEAFARELDDNSKLNRYIREGVPLPDGKELLRIGEEGKKERKDILKRLNAFSRKVLKGYEKDRQK